MVASSRKDILAGETSRRSPLGRYCPRRFNEHSRWRFIRYRRAELLRRIGGGPPDERQRLAIEMLAKAEWTLAVAEHDVDAATDAKVRAISLRIACDTRKMVLLWNRELTAATPRPAAAPADPAPSLEQTLADIVARRRSEPAEDDEEAA